MHQGRILKVGNPTSGFYSAPPILPFSIGLAGRPYNSVSTTVLHCEIHCILLIFSKILNAHQRNDVHYAVARPSSSRVLDSLWSALWRRSSGFGYNSAATEPIWMKSGALWEHCLLLAGRPWQILSTIRAAARNSGMGIMDIADNHSVGAATETLEP